MIVQFIQENLKAQGYRYMLLDDIESSENGILVLHYELLKEVPIEKQIDEVIALDSNLGSEILQEFTEGSVVLWLGGECLYSINSTGRIFRDQKFQILELQKYNHD